MKISVFPSYGSLNSKPVFDAFIENLKNKLHVLIICPGFTNSNIRKKALQGDGSQQGESPRSEQKMMSSEKVALEMIKAIKKRKDTLVLTNSGKLTVLLNKFFSCNLGIKIKITLYYNF